MDTPWMARKRNGEIQPEWKAQGIGVERRRVTAVHTTQATGERHGKSSGNGGTALSLRTQRWNTISTEAASIERHVGVWARREGPSGILCRKIAPVCMDRRLHFP